MPPAPLGGVVMDRPLAVAFRALEPGTAWMFNTDPDLLGFLIKLHICHGPGRRNPRNLLVKFFCLARWFSFTEKSSKSTINPDGPVIVR
jgi:hypothetical protein